MRELPLLLPGWPAPANVRAAMTTRVGGVSRPPFDSFNVARHTEDDPDAVAANRRRLVARLGLTREPVWLHQVHGNDIVRADQVSDAPAADASWTDVPGVACAVLVADCLPVLLTDRAGARVGAAHGGWRGLASGILETTVAAMGGRPEELMAWLGAAIGPDAFEVGPEVKKAFVDRWPETETAFRTGNDDRHFCDIYAIARIQLRELGITSVHGGDHCTVSEPGAFYSFRRDGLTGRMAALVWLAEPQAHGGA